MYVINTIIKIRKDKHAHTIYIYAYTHIHTYIHESKNNFLLYLTYLPSSPDVIHKYIHTYIHTLIYGINACIVKVPKFQCL